MLKKGGQVNPIREVDKPEKVDNYLTIPAPGLQYPPYPMQQY